MVQDLWAVMALNCCSRMPRPSPARRESCATSRQMSIASAGSRAVDGGHDAEGPPGIIVGARRAHRRSGTEDGRELEFALARIPGPVRLGRIRYPRESDRMDTAVEP